MSGLLMGGDIRGCSNQNTSGVSASDLRSVGHRMMSVPGCHQWQKWWESIKNQIVSTVEPQARIWSL